jgi:hypothetical protein
MSIILLRLDLQQFEQVLTCQRGVTCWAFQKSRLPADFHARPAPRAIRPTLLNEDPQSARDDRELSLEGDRARLPITAAFHLFMLFALQRNSGREKPS